MNIPTSGRRPDTIIVTVHFPRDTAFLDHEEALVACTAVGDDATRAAYAQLMEIRDKAKQRPWSLIDDEHMPRSRPAVREMLLAHLFVRGWTVEASEALNRPNAIPSWGVKLVNADPRYEPIEGLCLNEESALAIAWHIAMSSSIIVIAQ